MTHPGGSGLIYGKMIICLGTSDAEFTLRDRGVDDAAHQHPSARVRWASGASAPDLPFAIRIVDESGDLPSPLSGADLVPNFQGRRFDLAEARRSHRTCTSR